MANIFTAAPPPARTALIDRPERSALTLIAIGLAFWFFAAQLITFFIPDTEQTGFDAGARYLRYAVRNGGAFLFVCAFIALFRFMRSTGDTPLIQYFAQRFAARKMAIPLTVFRIVFGLASFALFLFAYSTIKTRIPNIMPYAWDETFANLDRLLFLGHDPWKVFAFLYDMPIVLRTLDVIYDIWAVILVGIWVLCFISEKHKVSTRYRFPLAIMLTWFIGGNVFAILLSSAGPCYYGLLTGLSDPYVAQMASLEAIHTIAPLRAFQYQEILWSVYESPSVGVGGISAMPSMHCATSFLLILLAWNRPVLRIAAMAFFAIIFVTSFVLAWHYAVDGVLAVPIALAGWWGAGKILRRFAEPKAETV